MKFNNIIDIVMFFKKKKRRKKKIPYIIENPCSSRMDYILDRTKLIERNNRYSKLLS